MRYCVAYKCRAVAHFFCYMHLWDIHGVALFLYGNEAAVKGAAMVP